MKNKRFLKLVRWFCSVITFNELAAAVLIFHEILSGKDSNYKLKEEEPLPNFRAFRTSFPAPLTKPPNKERHIVETWQELKARYERQTGKTLRPVKRRNSKAVPPDGCICQHCGAPKRYLYINNGKKVSQVTCKICSLTSPIAKARRTSNAKLWCPHCGYALAEWKNKAVYTAYKCPNSNCPFLIANRNKLSDTEKLLAEKKSSQFKVHYQFRKYNFANLDLSPAKIDRETRVNLNRIHKDLHTVSLALCYTINMGLSSRLTVNALKNIHGIKISYQTVLNYCEAAAALIEDFVEKNSPKPEGVGAADETYILVEGIMHYTWLLEDSETKALCGYNISNRRNAESAIALLCDVYGHPNNHKDTEKQYTIVTDGLASYDTAVMAYNEQAGREVIIKKTVIGLQNLDPESEEYRSFKQLIERLNRTYKYHTRPRAGFKTFNGAVILTTLFVAYYNFIRVHSTLKTVPVKLECIENVELWPNMWSAILANA